MSLLLSWFIAVSIANAQVVENPVQKICDARPAKRVVTVEDLHANLCAVAHRYPADSKNVLELANNVSDILKKIAPNASLVELRNSGSLKSADPKSSEARIVAILGKLKTISAALDDKYGPATNGRKDLARIGKKAAHLKTLLAKTPAGQPASAEFQAESKAYFELLREELGKTRNGKEVLACYDKPSPYLKENMVPPATQFSEPQFIEEMSAEQQKMMESIAGGFLLEKSKNPAHSDRFDFKMVFKLGDLMNPVQALLTLGHEMKHGCIAEGRLRRFQEKLKHPDDDQVAEKMDQNAYTEEVQTHRFELELFKDIASLDKNAACGTVVNSNYVLGPSIVSLGEYYAYFEERLMDGTFPQFVARTYALGGGFSARSAFANMSPSLRKKMAMDYRDEDRLPLNAGYVEDLRKLEPPIFITPEIAGAK